MKDILLLKKCKECNSNITLMESCRGYDKNLDTYLVERCLKCGQYPVTEIAKLAEDQSGLNK